MNLKIKRRLYEKDGIISDVTTPEGGKLLTTLEHAYPSGLPEFAWLPKVQPGVYRCVRGEHSLHDGKLFETFEVTGVPGHSGILFHHGNWNRDSEGCILTGDALAKAPDPKDSGSVHDLVTNTRVAFDRFMAAQEGCDFFDLEVVA